MLRRRSWLGRLIDRLSPSREPRDQSVAQQGFDEFGLPRAWRRDPPKSWALAHSNEQWPSFERWCKDRGVRAFPASARTVLQFVQARPVEGTRLFRTWQEIDLRHDAYYWHVDANPVQLLTLGGVQVSATGDVTVPEEVTQRGRITLHLRLGDRRPHRRGRHRSCRDTDDGQHRGPASPGPRSRHGPSFPQAGRTPRHPPAAGCARGAERT